jgi:hypothetical protein
MERKQGKNDRKIMDSRFEVKNLSVKYAVRFFATLEIQTQPGGVNSNFWNILIN